MKSNESLMEIEIQVKFNAVNLIKAFRSIFLHFVTTVKTLCHYLLNVINAFECTYGNRSIYSTENTDRRRGGNIFIILCIIISTS